MRNAFFLALLFAVLFCGCGHAVFAPSLRQPTATAQPFPWWDEGGPDTADSDTASEQRPRTDYPSPLRVGDMVITHSGLWRLVNQQDGPEGMTAFLRSDHGWEISIVHLRTGTAVDAVLAIQQDVESALGTVQAIVAQMILADPELRAQLLAVVSEAELQEAAMAIAAQINGMEAPVMVVEHNTPDAASCAVHVQGHTTVVYGLRTDYNDPRTAVVVMGDWDDDAGPLPLMELTEITHNLRIEYAAGTAGATQ